MTSRFESWTRSNYSVIEQGINGARGTQIHLSRAEALTKLLAEGVPTTHDEEWRYTNFSVLESNEFSQPLEAGTISLAEVEKLSLAIGDRVVLVDGFFSAALSSIAGQSGVTVEALSEYLHGNSTNKDLIQSYGAIESLHQRSLNNLNLALIKDGIALIVKKGITQQMPLEVIHLSTPSNRAKAVMSRSLICIEESAHCTVVERFIGSNGSEEFCCAVSEISLADNAQCDYYALAEHQPSVTHYHSLQVEMRRASNFRSHLFPFSGKVTRNEANLNLLGSGSDATINGLVSARGSQHIDNSTVIRHAEPHCESSELFKGIYREQSRGVFQGTIIVEKPAQKTNAFQSNQAILLSKEASMDSKPQLKIWADDVKCSHGATVGQLDDEALFYIKSRGIDDATARELLVDAFAGEVLSAVRIEKLREYVRSKI